MKYWLKIVVLNFLLACVLGLALFGLVMSVRDPVISSAGPMFLIFVVAMGGCTYMSFELPADNVLYVETWRRIASCSIFIIFSMILLIVIMNNMPVG